MSADHSADTPALYQGGCLEVLQATASNSIDAVITDPPYNLGSFMKCRAHNLGNMRANNFVDAGWDNAGVDEWEALMAGLFTELARVTIKGGALIVFMAAIKVETVVRLAQQSGWYYKTTGIWHKTNPMPRNMNLHYINSVESWIYFTNGTRTGTFNNEGKALHDYIETGLTPVCEKRHGKHPTQKPLALMRHFIETLTHPGQTVLDPFAGSGSTLVAAMELGRESVGIELDPQYHQLIKDRLASCQPQISEIT